MNTDLLSVAPRLTELVQAGLAELVDKEGRRGIYRGIEFCVAAEREVHRRMAGDAEQMLLKF